MSIDLPQRIAAATDAGRLRADEVWLANGWRKAPGQCPIAVGLLPGTTPKEAIAILDAWLRGYTERSNEHSAAVLV